MEEQRNGYGQESEMCGAPTLIPSSTKKSPIPQTFKSIFYFSQRQDQSPSTSAYFEVFEEL